MASRSFYAVSQKGLQEDPVEHRRAVQAWVWDEKRCAGKKMAGNGFFWEFRKRQRGYQRMNVGKG